MKYISCISGRKNVSKNVSKSGCKTDPWNCGVTQAEIPLSLYRSRSKNNPFQVFTKLYFYRMPPRSLRTKKPVRYLVEHDEDELITSETEEGTVTKEVVDKDPDFDEKVQSDNSDKENETDPFVERKRAMLDDRLQAIK